MAVVFPIKYGTVFSSSLVQKLVTLIVLISVMQSSLFAQICLFIHDVFVDYEEEILAVSNTYWTVSTCTAYILIILTIAVLSFLTAKNLKKSIKAAEKLRNPSLPNTSKPDAGASESERENSSRSRFLGKKVHGKGSKSGRSSVESIQSPEAIELKMVDKNLSSEVSGASDEIEVSPIQIDKAKSGRNSGTGNQNQEAKEVNKARSKTLQRDLRLTKALLVVAIAYVIVCTPYTLYIAVFRLAPIEFVMEVPQQLQMSVKLFVHTLYLFNYAINPFTYIIFNEFFRSQVFKLLPKCTKRGNGKNTELSKHEEEHQMEEHKERMLPEKTNGITEKTTDGLEFRVSCNAFNTGQMIVAEYHS